MSCDIENLSFIGKLSMARINGLHKCNLFIYRITQHDIAMLLSYRRIKIIIIAGSRLALYHANSDSPGHWHPTRSKSLNLLQQNFHQWLHLQGDSLYWYQISVNPASGSFWMKYKAFVILIILFCKLIYRPLDRFWHFRGERRRTMNYVI